MKDLPETEIVKKRGFLRGFKKISLKMLGFIFLILGLIGAIIPVMPSVPFLLVATACFFRSSPRLHNWMLNNRFFGKQLSRYHNKEGIPFYAKLITVLIILLSFALTTIFFIPTHITWLRILMIILAILYSIHIFIQPGLK